LIAKTILEERVGDSNGRYCTSFVANAVCIHHLFHIIFPSFTIGLAAWLTVLEALHLRTGRSLKPKPVETAGSGKPMTV
jgi:hypothetical protein